LVAQPLWNKQTDKTDHCVALYMRDHGYDLRYNLQTNWATLGRKRDLRSYPPLTCWIKDTSGYTSVAIFLHPLVVFSWGWGDIARWRPTAVAPAAISTLQPTTI